MRKAYLIWVAALALAGAVDSAGAQKIPVSVHKGADACMKQYSEKSASIDACLADYTSLVNKIANDLVRAHVKAECQRAVVEMNNEFPPEKPTPEKIMTLQEWVYGRNKKAEFYDEYVDKLGKEYKEALDHFYELQDLYKSLLKACESDRARSPNSSEMQSARDARYFESDDYPDKIRIDDRGDHAVRDKLEHCKWIAASADGVGRGQCTSLLGKDMGCELYKKIVAECTVCSSSDVGLATPRGSWGEALARRCAPSSELRVNRPARPNSKALAKSSPSDAKSFGVSKKNNLDRFDLGPTFVSPDSSSGVSRTARSAGSSKTQTKTLKPVGSQDAPASSSPPPPSPIPLGGGTGGTVIERPK